MDTALTLEEFRWVSNYVRPVFECRVSASLEEEIKNALWDEEKTREKKIKQTHTDKVSSHNQYTSPQQRCYDNNVERKWFVLKVLCRYSSLMLDKYVCKYNNHDIHTLSHTLS